MAQQDIYVVKLAFSAPLHLHNERADYAESLTRLHSDKIYAALMQIKALYGLKMPIIDLDSGTTTFTISSAFPYTTVGTQTVYFLPRPFKRFDDGSNEQEGRAKALKKIEWIDSQLYRTHLEQAHGVTVASKVHKAYLCEHPIESFMTKQVEPKVRISREGKDAEPYYLERLFFQKGSGMYLIFKGSETDFNLFYKIMGLLGQEGIGTDRNIGNGIFKIEQADASALQIFQNLFEIESDHAVNLSLYLPQNLDLLKQQLDSKHAGYTLIKRGGWITTEDINTLRKKGSYFFAEGGVFKLDASQSDYTAGNVINLSPNRLNNRNIWRVGKSLFVPIKMA